MPPIQIQLNSPINPTAAKATSPTRSPADSFAPPAITTTTNDHGPYTPVRPTVGAAPSFATPTTSSHAAQPSPSSSPTRSTTGMPQFETPPPPQPGTLPAAPQITTDNLTPRTSVSAARSHSRNHSTASMTSSRKGSASLYAPANPFTSDAASPSPSSTTMPPQFSLPAAQASHDNTHVPVVCFITPAFGDTPAPDAPTRTPSYTLTPFQQTLQQQHPHHIQSLQHPPGYMQNPYADAMSPSARAAQEAQEPTRRSSVLAGLAGAVGVGGANDGTRFEPAPEEEAGAWGAAKKWMGGVAEKAVAVEGEVWRRFSTTR